MLIIITLHYMYNNFQHLKCSHSTLRNTLSYIFCASGNKNWSLFVQIFGSPRSEQHCQFFYKLCCLWKSHPWAKFRIPTKTPNPCFCCVSTVWCKNDNSTCLESCVAQLSDLFILASLLPHPSLHSWDNRCLIHLQGHQWCFTFDLLLAEHTWASPSTW